MRGATPQTVCVVIPTHNRPHLLTEAVRSVLAQDVADLRCVVVDEASNPPAQSVLLEDPRLTVVRNGTPRGPAAARNQGVDVVQSEFVGFLDDDDRWLPGKLRACLDCFQDHPDAGMVMHRMGSADAAVEAGDGRCRTVPDSVREMLTKQPPHVDAVLVRRAVHDRVRFDEEFSGAADLDYMLRVAMVAPVFQVDRVLGVHGPPSARKSAISLEMRIAGRIQFREKHAALFRDREIEAFYELRLGHLYRRAGRRRNALSAYLRSMRLQPTSPLPWKGLVTLVVPRSLPAARSDPRGSS
jgi:glycosyltransferase involved in cell wall biosynthesis